MKANILSLHTPSTYGVGSKVKYFPFLEEAMLHIKLYERSVDQHASLNVELTHPWPLGFY